jgi:hypothetical protein
VEYAQESAHGVEVKSENYMTAYRLDNVEQKVNVGMVQCSHKVADVANWGKVAMCGSFPYRWQCLFRGDGDGSDAGGGQSICQWTPYSYSGTSFDSATWNRMPGFKKYDASTSGVRLSSVSGLSEA